MFVVYLIITFITFVALFNYIIRTNGDISWAGTFGLSIVCAVFPLVFVFLWAVTILMAFGLIDNPVEMKEK
jgi:hypothetical protein